ncbi:guanyl-nucleotide exchange factor activity protein [[Candida] boidinii]|nr:guanyl-nucleotide exchange factor activity protein [[Candida] boidinii]
MYYKAPKKSSSNISISRSTSASSSTTAITHITSRTPSGPMGAADLIMNKQATSQDSLYYICKRLLNRLEKVPGMKEFLNLAYLSAEESSEQQALSLSQKTTHFTNSVTDIPLKTINDSNHNLNDSTSNNNNLGSSTTLNSLYSLNSPDYWSTTLLTFSAGILPAQINYDPVTPIWKLFQQGAPLCIIFNCLKPEESIEIITSDDLKFCKMNVYKFLSACKIHLGIRDDELFQITTVFSDDTNSLLKVINAVNLVLDLDPKFDSPIIESKYQTTDARSKVVKEIVESERKFVQDLETLFKYKNSLVKSELISSENINMLFPNIGEIVDFQRRFLIGLECNATVPGIYQRIGSIFLHAASQNLKVYEPWSLFQTSAINFINQESENLKKSSDLIAVPYELQAFLIKPIQRLCKYPLLLKDLVKLTDENWPTYKELKAALISAKEVAISINEAQRKSENLQLVKELQDRVIDWRGHNMISVGDLLYANVVVVKDLLNEGQSSEKEVHCYLFERVIYFFKELIPKKSSGLLNTRKRSTSHDNSNGNLSTNSSSQYDSDGNPIGPHPFSLTGMVYISKISLCSSSDSCSSFSGSGTGHFLTLRWKGANSLREGGGCIIKFKTSEQLNQWCGTIKKLSAEDEYSVGYTSPVSANYPQSQQPQSQQQQSDDAQQQFQFASAKNSTTRRVSNQTFRFGSVDSGINGLNLPPSTSQSSSSLNRRSNPNNNINGNINSARSSTSSVSSGQIDSNINTNFISKNNTGGSNIGSNNNNNNNNSNNSNSAGNAMIGSSLKHSFTNELPNGSSISMPRIHSRQKSDLSLLNYQQAGLSSYPSLPISNSSLSSTPNSNNSEPYLSQYQNNSNNNSNTSSANGSSLNYYNPPGGLDKKMRSLSSPANIPNAGMIHNYNNNNNINNNGNINNNNGNMDGNNMRSNSYDYYANTQMPSNFANMSIQKQQNDNSRNGSITNSIINNINIKLLYEKKSINLCLDSNLQYIELINTFVNKIKITMGNNNINYNDLKFKYKDEDDDFVRFQSEEDWYIAKEMLEEKINGNLSNNNNNNNDSISNNSNESNDEILTIRVYN